VGRLASVVALAAMPLTVACASPPETNGPGGPLANGGVGGTNPTAGSGAFAGSDASAGTGGFAGSASGGTGGLGAAGQGAAGATGGTTALHLPVITNKAVHRLSNVEYDNTLRDLTGTELRFGTRFLREEADGFDNIATALSMSPRQVEDYFVAARQVSADIFASQALRDRVVTCAPDTGAVCAETVIRDFGLRAFRRPLTAAESTRLRSKYDEAVALGLDALGALEHLVHVVLSSPQFLYRVEFDPDLANAAPHPLDSYELASRLSYALWSSTPDDPLLAEAGSGGLAQPEASVARTPRRALAAARSRVATPAQVPVASGEALPEERGASVQPGKAPLARRGAPPRSTCPSSRTRPSTA
jgi:hypothetical protein